MLGGLVGTTVAGEVQARAAEGEHRGRPGPGLIPLDQAREQPLEPFEVRRGRHDVAPRLLVIGRGRPACRLEQRAEVVVRDGAVGEGARAPAFHEQFVDRMIRACFLRMAHLAVLLSWVMSVRRGPHRSSHCKRRCLNSTAVDPADSVLLRGEGEILNGLPKFSRIPEVQEPWCAARRCESSPARRSDSALARPRRRPECSRAGRRAGTGARGRGCSRPRRRVSCNTRWAIARTCSGVEQGRTFQVGGSAQKSHGVRSGRSCCKAVKTALAGCHGRSPSHQGQPSRTCPRDAAKGGLPDASRRPCIDVPSGCALYGD